MLTVLGALFTGFISRILMISLICLIVGMGVASFFDSEVSTVHPGDKCDTPGETMTYAGRNGQYRPLICAWKKHHGRAGGGDGNPDYWMWTWTTDEEQVKKDKELADKVNRQWSGSSDASD